MSTRANMWRGAIALLHKYLKDIEIGNNTVI